jgi:hypothetical protein
MNKLASNPIVVIALGLILGVGTGVGYFMKVAKPLIQHAREARLKAVKSNKPDAPWDFWTIDIENLANELKEEKAVVKKREEELNLRDTRIQTEQAELLKQRKELESLRADITSKMTEIQIDELKNLKALAATYSTLTPKACLAIFKEMEDTTVVKLLSIMKPEVVGPLFEEMGRQADTDPALAKRAAALSEKLRLIKAAKTAVNQ